MRHHNHHEGLNNETGDTSQFYEKTNDGFHRRLVRDHHMKSDTHVMQTHAMVTTEMEALGDDRDAQMFRRMVGTS